MSLWRLGFTERIDYSSFADISIPIAISTDLTNQVQLQAKLDTGSTFCVFQPRYANLLGLDLEGGTTERIRTVSGSFTAYGHEVTLLVRDIEWQAYVCFADDEAFPVNVLGRIGFLDRLDLGLVDYEQILYLNAYSGGSV